MCMFYGFFDCLLLDFFLTKFFSQFLFNVCKMVEIVFVGRSNVGKSSLIRTLTGKKVDVGKKPGVTRDFKRLKLGKGLEIVDLPGFGFISGISESRQEKIKEKIVNYLEKNNKDIITAIQVIDSTSFLEIANRWEDRNQIPVDIELFSFLEELSLKPILAANKIDKLNKKDLDSELNGICKKLGMDPPWRQWLDIIVPISAKTGKGVDDLKKLLRKRLRDEKKDNLLRYL